MSKMIPFTHKSRPAPSPYTNVFDDFFGDTWFPLRMPELETFRLDVKEDAEGYTVEAEVPGAKKKDISLELSDGRLTIGVAAKEVAEEDKKKLLHRERRYTFMERSIYLADAADAGAEAKLEHGVLAITVPKAKNSSAHQKIDIQ